MTRRTLYNGKITKEKPKWLKSEFQRSCTKRPAKRAFFCCETRQQPSPESVKGTDTLAVSWTHWLAQPPDALPYDRGAANLRGHEGNRPGVHGGMYEMGSLSTT